MPHQVRKKDRHAGALGQHHAQSRVEGIEPQPVKILDCAERFFDRGPAGRPTDTEAKRTLDPSHRLTTYIVKVRSMIAPSPMTSGPQASTACPVPSARSALTFTVTLSPVFMA